MTNTKRDANLIRAYEYLTACARAADQNKRADNFRVEVVASEADLDAMASACHWAYIHGVAIAEAPIAEAAE